MKATSRPHSPMKALGIVILSHILSLISRPESGAAIALTTLAMGDDCVSFISSYGPVARDRDRGTRETRLIHVIDPITSTARIVLQSK